jgi:hypothetical protein
MRTTTSRRAILNVASTKKKDNMVAFQQTGSASEPTQGPLTITGNPTLSAFGEHIIMWMPTARSRGTVPEETERNSQTCFMRGLSERINISTDTSLPWTWRRVCFTLKGLGVIRRDGTAINVLPFEEVAPNGYVRLARNYSSVGGDPNWEPIAEQLISILMDGTRGTDFLDLTTAKTDGQHVTVKYDRTFRLASGNDSGIQRVFKLWHPMNKNLVYDDDEDGGDMVGNAISTQGKPGMGDYYVVDIFKAHPTATSSDHLLFDPMATLYWHEK